MKHTKEERNLLQKLKDGELDGRVGDTLEYGDHKKVYYDKFIKDGIPTVRRTGEGYKFFDGKENTRVPGNVEDTPYENDSDKLEFLQRYGWLIDDQDAKEYSKKYKK